MTLILIILGAAIIFCIWGLTLSIKATNKRKNLQKQADNNFQTKNGNYKFYYSNNNGKDDYGLKHVDENGNALICKEHKIEFPPQKQDVQPGMEYLMQPRPIFNNPYYKSAGKLRGKMK